MGDAEDEAPYPTCPDCAAHLQLHELDPTGPGCLLGWCPSCRAIFPVLDGAGRLEVAGRATLRLRPPREGPRETAGHPGATRSRRRPGRGVTPAAYRASPSRR